MGPYFIDFEAFQHGEGDTYIKELCIVDVDKPLFPLYYLFAPERLWDDLRRMEKYTYNHQTKNYHQLEWNEGTTRFCHNCVMNHIAVTWSNWSNSIFYVMEKDTNGPKLRLLKKHFPHLNIVNDNISFYDLPPIPQHVKCLHREHGEHCAYFKCLRMITHYIQ